MIRIAPPHDRQLTDQTGNMSLAWSRHHDELAAAARLAQLAAPAATAVVNTRLINAGAGLQGGGDLSADLYIGLYKFVGPVANLPTTGNTTGEAAFATDACNSGEGAGSGTGCIVYWSAAATAWRIPNVATAVTA